MKKKFTKPQLEKLEKLHYLNTKFYKKGNGSYTGGLCANDYELRDKLIIQCGKFFKSIIF